MAVPITPKVIRGQRIKIRLYCSSSIAKLPSDLVTVEKVWEGNEDHPPNPHLASKPKGSTRASSENAWTRKPGVRAREKRSANSPIHL